jgi:hypothetical protein
MGKKIFVSYKYADTDVCPLYYNQPAKVRDYVDIIEKYLDKTDDIYKGESAKEDLSDLSEEAIWKRLKDRIYDSTVTIVLISPNMKEHQRRDRSQWIPWEISYSLKEIERADRVSRSNAVFAVVLPDRNGSYEYFIKSYFCCETGYGIGCAAYDADILFDILKNNMFNQKRKHMAQRCYNGKRFCLGDASYIHIVTWTEFTSNARSVINKAIEIKNKIDEYDICKEV